MYNRQQQQSTQLGAVGNNTTVDPFGSNAAAALAYKKMERLVTATHMVTNYVPKSENLRQRVRDIASNLLTDTITLRSGLTSLGAGALGNITAQVRLILSLLDALYASGLISEMNLRVLKEAYRDFVQNLSAMASGSAGDSVVLTSEYFSQATAPAPKQSESHNKRGHTVAPRTSAQAHNTQSTGKPVAATQQKKRQITERQAQAKSVASNDRVQTIIDFITKRGSASTGDVAQLITGCSSKTLQRDLTKLVAIGTLTKEGSKRWTRYSLA